MADVAEMPELVVWCVVEGCRSVVLLAESVLLLWLLLLLLLFGGSVATGIGAFAPLLMALCGPGPGTWSGAGNCGCDCG